MQNKHHDMYIRHTYIYILIVGATSQCAETTTVNPPPPALSGPSGTILAGQPTAMHLKCS